MVKIPAITNYKMENMMRILGIDPGTATTGFGVVDREYNNCKAVDYGIIETTPDLDMPERLKRIHEGICWLIEEYQPDELVVEELFFNRNVTTAITVGQARGVVLLAAAQHNIPTSEYTPMQVKQAITGYGGADKKQVQMMVKNILKLATIPRPDDAADALAIAVCHSNWLQSRKWEDALNKAKNENR